jgi:hypothetical protein
MIRRILSILTFGAISSRKNTLELGDLDPEMQALVQDVARRQASGLDGAEIVIHSVTGRNVFHRATPQPGERLVVIDVTFTNHQPGFGLAGVELIDGRQAKARSYGNDPYQVYLNPDGTLMEDQSALHLCGPIGWKNEHPIRVFLVYSAPPDVDWVGLGYWGKVIVDRPYEVVPGEDVIM